ncbi:flippase [Novosphingobium sp.]|uniref:flippase n=1 Tax=Novosphingobium sp. TaxID=1874826 RepID=UPI002605AF04|nr:flippase [Novosphingobium sp.]
MSLARHTTYNLVGTVLPIVLALVTVPIYLKQIGAERYGVLSLAWIILGYFGVFDLGLGRAVTQRIAASRGDTAEARARIIGTALVANLVIGLAGAAILLPAVYYVFQGGIGMSASLRSEAYGSAPILALALPISTTFGLLNGALIGREKFASVNAIGVVSSVLFQIVPLSAAIYLGNDLSYLLLASILARGVGTVILARECQKEFGVSAFVKFDRAYLSQLIHYGGWVTVTGLISPLLVVGDRFFIGKALGAAAVAVYSLPTQITSRLSPLAGALGNAVFPRLAAADMEEADRLSELGARVLYACMTAPVAFGIAVMAPAMELWLGSELGSPAGPVGRVMLVAAWINVFGQVPFWRLHAQGRPRAVALAHLAEIVVYIPLLLLLVAKLGLVGAALASLGRMAIDAALLRKMANCRLVGFASFAGALSLFAAEEIAIRMLEPGLPGSLMIAALAGVLSARLSWFVLPTEGREAVIHLRVRFLRRLVGKVGAA